jgi:hypothetical protein
MTHAINMKRLHQGCGESLQSNLPGIPARSRPQSPGFADGRARAPHRLRLDKDQRRDESEFR